VTTWLAARDRTPQNRLFINAGDTCRRSDTDTFGQGTSDGLEERFLKMGMVKSRACSWSRPGTGSTTHEALLRVEEQAGNTVGLKCTPHLFGKV